MPKLDPHPRSGAGAESSGASETGLELEAAISTDIPSLGDRADTLTTALRSTEAGAVLAEPVGTLAPAIGLPTKSAAPPPKSGKSLGSDPASIEAFFEQVLRIVHENRPNDDLELIRRAWEFCKQQHTGQLRASGEPYIIHPLEVAHVLADLKMDSTAIAGGLLHDAVEDTDVTSAEIAKRFNEQVAHIVEGVTKLDKIKFANREDHQAENIRKMLLAMVTDIRVVIIKLADRLHNMRTLEHLKPEKQQKIARETLDIFAPLAHRLGMGKLRGELEDLAFRYTDPLRLRAGLKRGRRASR